MFGNNYLKQLAFGARANSPVPLCRSSNNHISECSRYARRIMLFLKVVMVVSKSHYVWVKNSDAPDFDLLDGGELVGGDVVYLNQDVPRVQARSRRDSPRFRRRLRQTGQAPSPRMLPPLLVYSCPLPFSLSCFVRCAEVVQFIQMRWIRTAVPVVPFWRLAGTTRRRTVCVPSARSSASMCTYG